MATRWTAKESAAATLFAENALESSSPTEETECLLCPTALTKRLCPTALTNRLCPTALLYLRWPAYLTELLLAEIPLAGRIPGVKAVLNTSVNSGVHPGAVLAPDGNMLGEP